MPLERVLRALLDPLCHNRLLLAFELDGLCARLLNSPVAVMCRPQEQQAPRWFEVRASLLPSHL